MTIFNAHYYDSRDQWRASIVETYPFLENWILCIKTWGVNLVCCPLVFAFSEHFQLIIFCCYTTSMYILFLQFQFRDKNLLLLHYNISVCTRPLTWIAFAVLKRKSGEEYLIRNKFEKFSTAAMMWLFWGLKDGSANLGLNLKKRNRTGNYKWTKYTSHSKGSDARYTVSRGFCIKCQPH